MSDEPENRRFLAVLRESVGRPDECWAWKGYVMSNGYPLGNQEPAYRATWKLLVGPIPDGLELDHLCKNPLCVNPHHLEPVTQRENNRRSSSPPALLAGRPTCKHGHPFDVDNTGWRKGRNGALARVCRTCSRLRMRQYAAAKRAS